MLVSRLQLLFERVDLCDKTLSFGFVSFLRFLKLTVQGFVPDITICLKTLECLFSLGRFLLSDLVNFFLEPDFKVSKHSLFLLIKFRLELIFHVKLRLKQV